MTRVRGCLQFKKKKGKCDNSDEDDDHSDSDNGSDNNMTMHGNSIYIHHINGWIYMTSIAVQRGCLSCRLESYIWCCNWIEGPPSIAVGRSRRTQSLEVVIIGNQSVNQSISRVLAHSLNRALPSCLDNPHVTLPNLFDARRLQRPCSCRHPARSSSSSSSDPHAADRAAATAALAASRESGTENESHDPGPELYMQAVSDPG